jgi:hypothetical protein
MYPDYSPIGWIIFVIIFFIIPGLLFIVLKAFTKLSQMSTALAIGSVLLVGPTFGLFQGYRERVELQKFGVWTKAVVIKHEFRNERTGKRWIVKYEYTVNQTVYQTNYHDDKQNQFVKGDMISVIYSKAFPKIYALGYEWNK